MEFDFFGEVRHDGIVRLMTLFEFIGDSQPGQIGWVDPSYFYWTSPKCSPIELNGVLIESEMRLLGNAYVADRMRPSKSNRYLGHVVKITACASGIAADFSMVETIDLSEDRLVYGDSICNVRKVFGSVSVEYQNLESII